MTRSNDIEPLLEVEHLGVSFGGVKAIADVTFKVATGEILSLIGPNGAGKTTAFNIISGFLRPDSGTMLFGGRSLAGLSPEKVAKAGLIRTFQKTSLFERNTVLENILIGLHCRAHASAWQSIALLPSVKREEQRLRELAKETLTFVGLGHRADQAAGTLPYGEQRLLEIAIALAGAPTLLLLDEPACGMNPTEELSLRRLLSRIRDQGITILLVEHNMRMVMGLSDRIVVLNQGRIIGSGSPEAIQNDPDVIEAYLGHGQAHA